MSAKTHPLTYIHPFCGQPAFHRTHIPEITDTCPGPVGEYELLSGPAHGYSLFRCGSCLCLFGMHERAAMTLPENYVVRHPRPWEQMSLPTVTITSKAVETPKE